MCIGEIVDVCVKCRVEFIKKPGGAEPKDDSDAIWKITDFLYPVRRLTENTRTHTRLSTVVVGLS